MKKHAFLSVAFSLILGVILSLGIVVSAACAKKEEPAEPETTTEELAAPVTTLTDNVLSWAAVDHADGYEIFEGETSVKTQSQTSYTIDKIEPGSYTYTVKATSTDAHYTTSKASNAQTYVVSAPPQGGGSESDTPEPQYENVTTSVDFVAAAKEVNANPANTADATVSGSYTYSGKITFSNGQRFEPNKKSGDYVGCLNTQGKQPMTVKLEGVTNSIKIYGAGASGSSNAYLTISSVAGDGTLTALENGKSDEVANNTFFSKALEVSDLPAGTYSVATSGSIRIYEFSITERLEVGTPAGMVLVPGTVDLLKGRSFTSAGLAANVNYTNGSVKSKTNLTVDSSAVDMTKAGEYPVKVSYTENGVTVNGEYNVKVYEVTAVGVGTTITAGNKQTNFKRVYVKGGTFSSEGLTLTATAACGQSEASFKLLASEYEATEIPDLTTTGEKNYTLSVKATARGTAEVKATLYINVVDAASAEGNLITVSVNRETPVSSTSFRTITDALVYLKQLNLDENVTKVINIADGTYAEKVYIDIPNVQLIGSSAATPNHTTDNGVVIEFDAIAGKLDPSGAAYGTNGSGTVTVAADAKNFVARNITFKNFYNTYELYQDSLIVSSDSQAVALLVESPSAAFFNCKLTSYHDTLYSNKGNHYYENCWIEGHTDFIFGQDAKAYFHNCHILSIGAGAEEKNGGYVVALKPSSSNYYFVFNTCDFAADENTKDGSVALGRAWGADMKMVIINSAISKAFSTAEHTAGTSSGQRYCTMSGNEPKPANMIECNNSGAGSITSSLNNTCTYDSAAATAYGADKLEQILGWDPTATYYNVKVHVGEDSYEFSVKGGTTLDKEALSQLLEGESVTIEIGNVWTNSQKDAAYTDGEVSGDLELWVEGAVDMTVTEDFSISFRSGAEGRFTGTVNSGETLTFGKLLIDGGETGSFVDNNNNDWYILSGDASIIIKLNAKCVLTVGYYETDTITIKSNGTIKDCAENGASNGNYSVSYTAEADGELVTITMKEGKTQLYIGTISVSVRTVIKENTTIDFTQFETTVQSEVVKFQGIEVDATEGKVRSNGNSVQVTGSVKFKIYCNSGATININYFSGYEAEATVGEYDASDGSITITVTKDGYIVSFEITYPEA